ncbi:MAG: signal peptidase I [Andreesenia angusta]|nr:signal peptidase I [Andreesenia angusta]
MFPTLHENDRIFVNKIVYRLKEPKRGDIITLHAPDRENTEYIKRIVGIPGDNIKIRDGKVILNGEVLKEDYIEPGSYTETHQGDEWNVPEGKVFVLGDNRAFGASKDSRSLGLIDSSEIVGRAGLRYYPFNRIEELAK